MKTRRCAHALLTGRDAYRIAHERCRNSNQLVRGTRAKDENKKSLVKYVRLFTDFTPILACAMPAWKMIIKRAQKLNRFVRGKSQNDTRKKTIRKVIGFAIARTPIRHFSRILENGHTIFGVALSRGHASPKGRALWLAPPGAPPGRFPPEVEPAFGRLF